LAVSKRELEGHQKRPGVVKGGRRIDQLSAVAQRKPPCRDDAEAFIRRKSVRGEIKVRTFSIVGLCQKRGAEKPYSRRSLRKKTRSKCQASKKGKLSGRRKG